MSSRMVSPPSGPAPFLTRLAMITGYAGLLLTIGCVWMVFAGDATSSVAVWMAVGAFSLQGLGVLAVVSDMIRLHRGAGTRQMWVALLLNGLPGCVVSALAGLAVYAISTIQM